MIRLTQIIPCSIVPESAKVLRAPHIVRLIDVPILKADRCPVRPCPRSFVCPLAEPNPGLLNRLQAREEVIGGPVRVLQFLTSILHNVYKLFVHAIMQPFYTFKDFYFRNTSED